MKTETSNGRQIMEINIDDRTDDVEMEEKELSVISKPPSGQKKDVSMFLSLDGSTACMKECKRKTTECKAQCLRKNENGYTYVSGNKAMDIESDSSLTMDFDNTIMNGQWLDALRRQANTTHRKKRETQTPTLITPNRNMHTATLKVKLLLDTDVMQIFQNFVGGNATEAKNEAEEFFTLAMNTVEMYFASISGWGLSFNTSDNFNKQLNMSVWVHSIDSPPIVNNVFSSIAPLDSEDGELISKLYFDENEKYLYPSGVVKEFMYYMRRTYGAQTAFNHLQVITGKELWFEYYTILPNGSIVLDTRRRLAGFASTTGAVCENYVPLDIDLRFSFVKLHSPVFTRAMAHEIGHIEGAYHDQSGRCDDENYVMNPINWPKFSDFPAASYYNFSVCSAKDIASYLSRFTFDELTSCLYTSRPTETEFLSNFCNGFLGSKYGIETNCKIFGGTNSTICPNGDYTFANGYLPWDGCEARYEDNTYFPIFYCTYDNDCEIAWVFYQVLDGTKCLNEDGTKGDKVCYRGKCSSELEICADYEGDDDEEEESESDE